jgi:hypothetical protein
VAFLSREIKQGGRVMSLGSGLYGLFVGKVSVKKSVLFEKLRVSDFGMRYLF